MERNNLVYGVLGVLGLLAILLLVRTWNRSNAIEERLAQAERREELLEARAGEQSQEALRLAERAEEQEAQASEAEQLALDAARAQGDAEWERETARQKAERARAALEAAEADAATSQERYDELRAARKRELDRMADALAEIVETERTPLGMVMRRHPRTLAGTTREGDVVLVTVDGRQPYSSVGASFPESAAVLRWFGVTDGVSLDGGGSTTMVLNGAVVNSPGGSAERAVGDGLFVLP